MLLNPPLLRSENQKDWAFIADGSQLSLYDSTTNTQADRTTGETTSVNEVTLQSTIKSVAIKDALKENETLQVSIGENYPVKSLMGYKQIVLTTLSPFGGRDHGFAFWLIAIGIACFFLAIFLRYSASPTM